MPGVRNHSAINWAEGAKWSNTHRGKLGGSSWKDDGWSREAVDKKPCMKWNNDQHHKKSRGFSWKQDLGVLSGIKIQWESFFLAS